MSKEIKGLQELDAKVTELFGDLDKNILEIEQRINELNAAIDSRGMESLAAVQQNTKDKTELEQLKEAYDHLRAKRSRLLHENSPALYKQMRQVADGYFNEKDVERREKDVSEILEHWNRIKELDQKMATDISEESAAVNNVLAKYIRYLNNNDKDRLDVRHGFGAFRGMGAPYVDQIKDGRIY